MLLLNLIKQERQSQNLVKLSQYKMWNSLQYKLDHISQKVKFSLIFLGIQERLDKMLIWYQRVLLCIKWGSVVNNVVFLQWIKRWKCQFLPKILDSISCSRKCEVYCFLSFCWNYHLIGRSVNWSTLKWTNHLLLYVLRRLAIFTFWWYKEQLLLELYFQKPHLDCNCPSPFHYQLQPIHRTIFSLQISFSSSFDTRLKCSVFLTK